MLRDFARYTNMRRKSIVGVEKGILAWTASSYVITLQAHLFGPQGFPDAKDGSTHLILVQRNIYCPMPIILLLHDSSNWQAIAVYPKILGVEFSLYAICESSRSGYSLPTTLLCPDPMISSRRGSTMTSFVSCDAR